MKSLDIKGTVFSGKSEGAKFIRFPWVKKQLTEELGFTPHLGTLNIKLSGENLKLRVLLDKAGAKEILPETGFHRGRCFQAYLMKDVRCGIVIPEIPNYPRNILELVAPINLREKLQLKDGDSVDVSIFLG